MGTEPQEIRNAFDSMAWSTGLGLINTLTAGLTDAVQSGHFCGQIIC